MIVAPASRGALVVGKTLGGASVATVQGTIMLVLGPLIGVHLTALLVVEVIGLELLMAVAMTTFGVFIASRIQKMEGFQVVMQLLLFPMLFSLRGALPAKRPADLASRYYPHQPPHLRGGPAPPCGFRRAAHAVAGRGAVLDRCEPVRLHAASCI
jgi:hypothetical protein